MNLASQGTLWEPLESVLGRVGVLVGRLGASWDRLGPSRDLHSPVMACFGAGPGRLGTPSGSSLGALLERAW
eukprot:8539623-Pyramimonas_sp.AAC.1